MKYAVLGFATFGTARKRDSVRVKVANYVATHPTWGLAVNDAGTSDAGAPTLAVEVRLETRAEMLELYDQALAEVTSQGWLVASWLAYHECSHDEDPPRPCVHEERTVA